MLLRFKESEYLTVIPVIPVLPVIPVILVIPVIPILPNPSTPVKIQVLLKRPKRN